MRNYVQVYASVKLNRAMQLAEAGAYPDTFGRLLAHVPASLRDQLSARQIAAMIDALDKAFAAGRAHAQRGVIEESGIYDAGAEIFRPLSV